MWAKSTFFSTKKNFTLSDDKAKNFMKQAMIYSITELKSLQLYLNAFLLYLQH